MRIVQWLMTVLLLARLAGPCPAQHHNALPLPEVEKSFFEEINRGEWLVHAAVTGVETAENGNVRGTLTIDHVYVGPPELLQRTFIAGYSPAGDANGTAPDKPSHVGDKGIWVVRRVREESNPFPVLYTGAYGFDYSERQTPQNESGYRQAVSFAESIEKLVKASPATRIRALVAYATGPVSEPAAWAVRTLAQSDWPGTARFLHEVAAAAKVTVPAQMEADEALAGIDDENREQGRKATWLTSKRRFKMMRRWMTRPLGSADAQAALTHLDLISQTGRMPRFSGGSGGGALFELSRLAARNGDWPLEQRSGALAFVGVLVRRKQFSRSAAYAYLLPLFQAHPDFVAASAKSRETAAALAGGALSGLQALKPLSPAEAKPLLALLPRARDPVIEDRMRLTLELPRTR